MPGESYSGPLPELSASEAIIYERLKKQVDKMALEIGERNIFEYDKLCETAHYIESSLAENKYRARQLSYQVYD